jgi:hypothetical protein
MAAEILRNSWRSSVKISFYGVHSIDFPDAFYHITACLLKEKLAFRNQYWRHVLELEGK